MKITIIDYGAGNLLSVVNALERIGITPCITRDEPAILESDGIILPGVGAFGAAMEELRAAGLVPILKRACEDKIPLLGICLGMQMLFEASEESPGAEGLGLIPGECRRIPEAPGIKIPQIGWNQLEIRTEDGIYGGIPQGTEVYFVHSYHCVPKDPAVITATTFHGTTLCASVRAGSVMGCQFHPEKSGTPGLHMLQNFLDLCGSSKGGALC